MYAAEAMATYSHACLAAESEPSPSVTTAAESRMPMTVTAQTANSLVLKNSFVSGVLMWRATESALECCWALRPGAADVLMWVLPIGGLLNARLPQHGISESP